MARAPEQASKVSTRTAGPTSRAVLVLGMHRSGTSALTRALNLLGVDLGRDLMRAAADNNETGFWEHQGVVDAHEALMAELGMRWDDPRALPGGWLDGAAARTAGERIEAILEQEFADSPLWGVKDPRLCRLLPLWRPILARRGVRPAIVQMRRNPLEVARSLERRDDIPRGWGLLLWLRHQTEAVLASRGLEQVWTDYDAVMADWRAALGPVAETLGLPLALDDAEAGAAIDAFIRPSLRHHVLDAAALEDEPHLRGWVGDLHAATSGPAPELSDLAAAIAEDLDRTSFYFDDTFATWAKRELTLLETVRERDGMVRERDGRVEERDGRIRERDHRIAERDQRIAGLIEQVQDLNRTLQREREEAAGIRVAHDDAVADLEADRDRLARHIEAIRRSPSWRLTGPLRRLARLLRRPLSLGAPVPLEPVPENGLAGSARGFRQTGADPHFLLVPAEGRPPPGGLVRLRYTFDVPSGVPDQPRLYWRTDGGFAEDRSVLLPSVIGEPVAVTLALPPDVRGLRFDPPDDIGAFDIRDLSVEPLATLGADLRAGARALAAGLGSPARLPGAAAGLFRYLAGGASDLRTRRAGKVWTGDANDYGEWIAWYDTIRPADREAIASRIETLPSRPRFSVVMPVYNPPPRLLGEAIDSVLGQLYPDWELCVADDASTDPEIAPILDAYAARDVRVKVIHRPVNGHISAASNTALEAATGDYVALLDHDDRLPEHALYMMAEEIASHPEADILYSDEDKITETGERGDPYFKPDFDLDLFHGQNFVSHLGVYRRSLLTAIGGFREGFEGSQDYDLALRAVERSSAERIRHVPHVLYHWRILAGSVAKASGEKDYAHDRALTALREHLARRSIDAEATEIPVGRYRRVRYPVPDPAPLVSVVVPTRDRLELLRIAVESLLDKTDYPGIEVLIVDNGSTGSATLDWLREIQERRPEVSVIRDGGGFNFSRLNNLAAARAKGDVLCLLNNDTEVFEPGWLREMVGQVLRPEVGVVGAKLHYTHGSLQHAGVVMGLGGIAGHIFQRLDGDSPGYFGRAALAQGYSAVTAACLVTRREVWEAVGGLDETNLGIAFNDVDFCLRVREAGYGVVWTPHAALYHHESASRGSDQDSARRARFHREIAYMRNRWPAAIARDPHYSPNLSLTRFDCALAFPPRVTKPWRRPDAGDG